MADGTDLDVTDAIEVALEDGIVRVSFPPAEVAIPDADERIQVPRFMYLSPSEWRRILSTKPTHEDPYVVGFATDSQRLQLSRHQLRVKRRETIEKVEEQLRAMGTDPETSPAALAALTRMLEKLRQEESHG